MTLEAKRQGLNIIREGILLALDENRSTYFDAITEDWILLSLLVLVEANSNNEKVQ